MSFHGNCFHDIYVPFVRPPDADLMTPLQIQSM